ncbi:flagellar FlbD family protein [Ruminococcus sp.]|uniref:flagellar FlbD family protein n=1 Tax=Ruminococcus sp. TaxID=41978 RepID=UPI0025FB6533|nr:flagellar FlbD family protein [Ruminococcus sp.]MBQ6250206.1 flagellar FlbD family protein [Ruminococcus sp.]
MEITLTDMDGIRFQVSTALIKEFPARGDHTEVRLFDGSRFNVREVPAEILNKISEVSNETA